VIVISDNDVLLKLACCDLYAEFLSSLGVSHQDVHILNTARPVLTSNRVQKGIDAPSFQRLTAFLDAVQVVALAPDPNELLALTEQPNIDTGEAILFSVTPRMDDALLATGDKRSLQSLAGTNDAACRALCQKLAGKVVCFEQVLWKILDGAGFDAVRDKLVSGRECDKVLAIALGSGLNATEDGVREALTSYIDDLRDQTGLLLAP
jgi:hypothetical protein